MFKHLLILLVLVTSLSGCTSKPTWQPNPSLTLHLHNQLIELHGSRLVTDNYALLAHSKDQYVSASAEHLPEDETILSAQQFVTGLLAPELPDDPDLLAARRVLERNVIQIAAPGLKQHYIQKAVA